MIKNQISNVFFVPGVLDYGSKKIHKTATNNHILWEDKEIHKYHNKGESEALGCYLKNKIKRKYAPNGVTYAKSMSPK